MKEKFLDLGLQPLSNRFLEDPSVEEYKYNLSLCFDTETSLVSIVEQPDKKQMFNDEYPYSSSVSQSSIDHFRLIANDIIDFHLVGNRRILEIGSNDGVFLRNFPTDIAVGIEPCQNFADKTTKMGYETHAKFLDSDIAGKIGRFDVIYSANCMCHIMDIEEAFANVYTMLNDNGTFIFEDPSLLSVIQKASYDQFYDEHAHVFSILALRELLEKSGLYIYYVRQLNTHGGSNRVFCSKKPEKGTERLLKILKIEKGYKLDKLDTYKYFAGRISRSRDNLRRLLYTIKENNGNIIGYGATSKSATVYNYCDITGDIISTITDTTKIKQGRFTPGTHIPIVAPTDEILDKADFAFLGAWNYLDEIVQKEYARKFRFITHVPTVMVI